MSQCVILLSGKRYSGKDAFADALESAFMARNLSCYRCAFADEAKRRYANFNSIDPETLMYDRDFKEQHRRGIIEYAESMKDEFGPTYWANELLQAVPALAYKILIVTDHRFYHEFEAMRNTFPEDRIFTIRLDATDEEREHRGWTHNPDIDEHVSETSLDHFQFTYRLRLRTLLQAGGAAIDVANRILNTLQILPYDVSIDLDEDG